MLKQKVNICYVAAKEPLLYLLNDRPITDDVKSTSTFRRHQNGHRHWEISLALEEYCMNSTHIERPSRPTVILCSRIA